MGLPRRSKTACIAIIDVSVVCYLMCHHVVNYTIILEKWFPLWGERAHSLKFVCMIRGLRYQKQNRMEEETNHRLNNLPKVKIFSTLQVHHLILAFIINNKYISNYICIHT